MTDDRSPDPQLEGLLSAMDDVEVPPSYVLTPSRARDQFEEFAGMAPTEDVASTQDIAIEGPGGDLPLRLYRPETDRPGPLPVLLFLHGGGFVVGSLDTHDNVCAALANRAECLVVSVDYRLAPEHPFPAGLEDAYAALEWVDDYVDTVGGDPDRVAMGGDSAGGTLTAGATLLAADHEGPDLVHQSLIYPAVNVGGVREMDSYSENGEGYFLELETMRWFDEKYVQDEIHARNEYAAPLLARDLSGLPPATVVTAGFDPLRDEGVEYAERLREAGVDVDHRHYERMIHGFASMPGLVSQANDALDAVADRLRASF